MKNLRIMALMVCMGMMVFLPNAQAASLSVSPIGQFDASAATSVRYDVFFNVDASEDFTGASAIIQADLTFLYDFGELNNPIASDLVPNASITTVTIGEEHYGFFSLSAGTDLNFGAGSTNLLGALTFDIINPAQPFDGLADFSIRDSIDSIRDAITTLDGQVLQFATVEGADVGVSAVPIPGAAWLLGSGLLGLVGLKRRRKS